MSKREELAKIAHQVQRCRLCRLYKEAQHGVPGEGPANAKIFFIGQAPGRKEDDTGKPFVGRAGEFLNELLNEVGIDRKDVFITSIVKHFPPKNRVPRKDEITACKPYLLRQIEIINPRVVVLLGKVAQEAMVGEPLLKGRKVFTTYHPAAGMRFPLVRKRMRQDFAKLALTV